MGNADNLMLEGWQEDYQAFVEKFKPKKTTDDCYTPDNVYDAVADWVAAEYGLDRAAFVRPFWPGGDFERFAYPADCVVVDNPPFSILSRIIRFYTHTHTQDSSSSPLRSRSSPERPRTTRPVSRRACRSPTQTAPSCRRAS